MYPELCLKDKGKIRHLFEKAKRLWAELDKSSVFRRFFSFQNASFYDAVKSRIEYFILYGIPKAARVAYMANRLLTRIKPAAVLGPFIGYDDVTEVTVAKLARFHGIPVVIFQHGGVYGYGAHPIVDYIDYARCDYFLSYGEGCTDYIRKNNSPLENYKIKEEANQILWCLLFRFYVKSVVITRVEERTVQCQPPGNRSTCR